MGEELLNIHAILPHSRVNGPGRRLVVFFQGCNRACKGCFNPETHSFDTKNNYTAEDILAKAASGLEGITVSGGEPFLQPRGLLKLLGLAKAKGLSTVVYSGFKFEELSAMKDAKECLSLIDVLIDGGFEEDKVEPTLLARGSTNQRLHFLSGRYTLDDFYMPGKAEVIISESGAVTGTGFGSIFRTGK